MEWRTLAGVGLSTAGFLGYVAGIYVSYPGRSFSITAVMVGITLIAIGHQTRASGEP
ncbi:hypothetical protein SAMN04487948_101555 [Halogranum amylolyticum]|uniref:Uncharacterized protein n=1 Tax=Halogranum amylolyticum TaxID=660520 RepID=A0A1H8NHH4_9EURY|nr:hypothetical protein [Halogranum amylolyticum]SEO29016.1 hypothetical protein SAMN04487948_101555 [Halogranum amylolyticum]